MKLFQTTLVVFESKEVDVIKTTALMYCVVEPLTEIYNTGDNNQINVVLHFKELDALFTFLVEIKYDIQDIMFSEFKLIKLID